MDGKDKRSQRRARRCVSTLVVMVGVLGWVGMAVGQENPTEATAGPRPSVTILLDSSASMEWTQEGEAEYPKRLHPEVHDLEDPYPLQPKQYSSEYRMGVHAKDGWKDLEDGDSLDEWEQYNEYEKDWSEECPASDDYDGSDPEKDVEKCNPLAFGSCVVWEPPCVSEDDATDDGEFYERPSWNSHPEWTPNYYANQEWKGTSFEHGYGDEATEMGRRFRRFVRGRESKWNNLDPPPHGGSNEEEAPLRLLNASQPRHVTFKEVMAGEMVLKPYDRYDARVENLDASKYGPGCWLVPRQRGGSTLKDPVPPCCKDSESDGEGGYQCTETYDAYERFPDAKDPRPHLQEVYDGRKNNGLMDNMVSQVHFSVATFDSFKYPMSGDTWGKDGVDDEETVLWNPNQINDHLQDNLTGINIEEGEQDSGDKYNLGVYRIVGPTDFPTDEKYVVDANEIAEMSLVDTGTLKYFAYGDGDQETNDDESERFDLRTRQRDDDGTIFGEDVLETPQVPDPLHFQLEEYTGQYIGSTLASRQPITGSTPLGPAMFDMHNYYMDMATENQGFYHDDSAACRPKHVVTMTDGIPLPEASTEGDPLCEDVSLSGMGEAFNMDSDKYEYLCTERHIDEFVNDTDLEGEDSRYSPRVHVVSPAIQSEEVDDEQADKLASMARAGKTCAGWYLGDGDRPDGCGEVEDEDWIPDDPGTEKPCPSDDHPCLVKQYDDGDGSPSFTPYDDPSGSCVPGGYTCDYPALILQCNRGDDIDPADYRECRRGQWYSQAMQQMFNSILQTSGLQSRTTPAVTNELDNPGRTDMENQNGQYRLYSGTKVEGTNPVWRGVLFRERRMCTSGGTLDTPSEDDVDSPCESDYYECFHNEIERQVRPGWNGSGDSDDYDIEDRRRLFTSVPSAEIFDYEDNKATPSNPDACGYYHSAYHMQGTDSGDGEFGGTYLESSDEDGNLEEINDNDGLVDRRVPFEYEELTEAVGDALDQDDSDDSVADYFNVGSESNFRTLIDKVRGRHPNRQGRVLGGLLSSDPVAVEPPKRDLPIDSYRAFKSRYAQRATMLFFGTLDGMIHAVHTGVLDDSEGGNEVKVRTDPGGGNPSNGPASEQREAWSYLPQILHKNYVDEHGAGGASSNPKMLDGSPTVQDVRLCHADPAYNQNVQACRGICDDTTTGLCSGNSDCEVPPAMQWRTVLVQGLGDSGPGYTALDVTRPGGPDPEGEDDDVELPDPSPLWEFDPDWLRGQLEHMVSDEYYDQDAGKEQVCGPTECDTDDDDLFDDDLFDDDDALDDLSDDCEDDFFTQPRLSDSHSQPAIGTVLMPPLESDEAGAADVRRPVAVFGAGRGNFYGSDDDCEALAGQAIYVVDLQTGSILRRFVGAYDDPSDAASNKDFRLFDASIVGSPLLYDGSPGSLVTRGFIGDGKGRLYRMDFTGSDPTEWTITEFYDPTDGEEDAFLKDHDPSNVGAAHAQPSAALSRDGNLVVVYGLGQPGDGVTTDQENAMIALRENASGGSEELWVIDGDGTDPGENFYEGEKLTGPPVIFNQGVYFTSFFHRENNACASGNSRIWGVGFGDDLADEDADVKPEGLFDCNASTFDDVSECRDRNFEPKEDVLVQGLEVTTGPSCAVDPSGGANGAYGYNDGDSGGGEPQLIAQTGGSDPGTDNVGSSSSSGDFVNRMEVGREVPDSQFIPMSWSVVNQ